MSAADELRAERLRWELSDKIRDRRVGMAVVLEVAAALEIPAKQVRKPAPGRYAFAGPKDKAIEFPTRAGRRQVQWVLFNAGWHDAPYPECNIMGKRRGDGTSSKVVLIDAETAPTPEEAAARAARHTRGGATVTAPESVPLQCEAIIWSHGGACGKPATGTCAGLNDGRIPACDEHVDLQAESADDGEDDGVHRDPQPVGDLYQGVMCDHLDAHHPNADDDRLAECGQCAARWRRDLCACESCLPVPAPAAAHDIPGDIPRDDVEEHPTGASHDDGRVHDVVEAEQLAYDEDTARVEADDEPCAVDCLRCGDQGWIQDGPGPEWTPCPACDGETPAEPDQVDEGKLLDECTHVEIDPSTDACAACGDPVDQDDDEPERVDPDDPTSMVRPTAGDTVLLHDGTHARVLGLQAAVDHSFAVDRYHVLVDGRRRVIPVHEIAGYPEGPQAPQPQGEPAADFPQEDSVQRDMPSQDDAVEVEQYECLEPGCDFQILVTGLLPADEAAQFETAIAAHQELHELYQVPDGVPAIVQLDHDDQMAALERVAAALSDDPDVEAPYRPRLDSTAPAALPSQRTAAAR